MTNSYHTPVLLYESLELLNIKPDGFYLDATLGEAGHSRAILERLSSGGKLLSIDQDEEAIRYVRHNYQEQLLGGNWEIVQSNFAKVHEVLMNYNRKLDGVLMDLGISSRQIEIEGKGISYHNQSDPLDMRMDDQLQVTAADLLNALTEQELEKLFRVYGEERYAKRIARIIKESPTPVQSVGELNTIISRAVPATKNSSKHPSRRVFQALRIAVNDELNSLKAGLEGSFTNLNSNGRLVVISFHSLEDRIVKEYFNQLAREGKGTLITKKPIVPTDTEVTQNPRSHSAKVRAIEKL
ncbi:MAG: 16S rRNA (cytosine(1402)-N(4))-methyltransferase RsmH [Candidatus Dojkabacteria bacterium]|nr:MAG: 16S rRNA (cytosine(1402)-N(4))-methyltransferase RsmH [Candidatus Dojkabacteria bacterium]